MAQVTDFLLELGTYDAMCELSRQDLGTSGSFVSNTHIHLPPNFSAFETVQQAVDLAAGQGVQVLGVGNYYDFSIYQTFVERARQKGIFPLFGTEIIALETEMQQNGIRINDPGNPGKYYICGKGITRFEPFSSRAAELNSIIRKNDTLRMREMAAKLDAIFAEHGVVTSLDERAVIARIVARHGCKPEAVTLQERHLAQAFQEVFFEKVPVDRRVSKLTDIFGTEPKADVDDAVGIQGDIRSFLMKAGKACFVPETFVNLAQAKELIIELGGIPCYPVLADGSKQRCEYETPLEKLIQTLKDNNYAMVEFIPIRNQPDVLVEYVTAIRRAGIVVVAGTEHNTLDLLPIRPTCVNGQDIPKKVQDIFCEGVCVLAAHQFLSAHGKPGFEQLYNDSAANNKEELIGTFEKIGIAVLNKYFEIYKN